MAIKHPGPTFPKREMYSNIPGPIVMQMKCEFNAIIAHSFDLMERVNYSHLLSQFDPIEPEDSDY